MEDPDLLTKDVNKYMAAPMVSSKNIIELTVDPRDYRRWQRMASVLCLNVSEYIRRCTNAHTTILEHDSFNIVPGPHETTEESAD